MATFDYRRELTRRELLPAIGAGVAVGAVAAYVAQLLLRREPLRGGPGPYAGDRLPAPPVR